MVKKIMEERKSIK